jgi:hypothetical protein
MRISKKERHAKKNGKWMENKQPINIKFAFFISNQQAKEMLALN